MIKPIQSQFTVAHMYQRLKGSKDHCTSESTFISEILLKDKFKSFEKRVKDRLKELK